MSKMSNPDRINQNNLFDNPMVRSAREAMTPEQLDEYKRKGEAMYNTIDFTSEDLNDGGINPMQITVAYIIEGLKSGLHPSYLTDDERTIMLNTFGEKWEREWLEKYE